MHYRNVLTLIRRLATGGLAIASLALSSPLFAETGNTFPLISLFMPSLAEPAASRPEEALILHEIRNAPQPTDSIDLTSRPDNLWERLRNGFAMSDLNDDLVLYYQQWYQNRPDALRRMVERSRPFMHHIVEELEARGMPTELALLPMVESSFNPMAYSRAHASGLWQFIPATGKRFNLEQNWWHDQRRDIVASTDAALDYLQAIYDMHGDWHLALASYNWGEGAVKRAVDKNTARGLPTDYPSLNMPNETRHYVPKLQALKNIFGDPVLMTKMHIPEILNRPYFGTIGTERPMDVKTVARLANMPLGELVALNPSHNRPVMKADTSLVLPADKLEIFRSNLEKNAAPLTEWQTYTLKHGEKVDKLAPRFGITLPELLRVNGLSGKVRLGAGSMLLVPAGSGADDLEKLQHVDTLPQIIEPEPIVVPKAHAKTVVAGKKGPVGKANVQANAKTKISPVNVKTASKPDSKVVANSKPVAKPVIKTAQSSKPAAKAVAMAKPAAPGKVAKSANGRPG